MKIAIIGCGNMGGAIAEGIAGSKIAANVKIAVSNPSGGKLESIKNKYPDIVTTNSNVEVVAGADLIILAVKPWKIEGVINEIKDAIDYSYQSVASVAAGISLADLGKMLRKEDGSVPTIYRILPNTAVSVCESMTFITSENSYKEESEKVLAIFKELGDAMLITESQMDGCMALASCGIAYIMRYIRAATEGGVELGLYPRDAQKIVMQTMIGAVKLLEANGSHPESEIDKVTTPGGYTIRGLNAMEEAGFTTAVIKGLKACVK